MPGDEQLPAACYSWSWHHDSATKQKLRRLKRDLTALQLAHLHDLSVRWIRAMDHATLTDSTIIRRFLPWDARGFGTEPASSPETDALWQEFTAGLVALTTRFERAISPTEPLEVVSLLSHRRERAHYSLSHPRSLCAWRAGQTI